MVKSSVVPGDASPHYGEGWHHTPVDGSPLVSMVVAAYERPKQIKLTLYSLLLQTWGRFEIIVVHDGHSDRVREAVLSFDDDRIRYTELERRFDDYGHSPRERGAMLATGDWIGFTNDDNYYAPVYFERLLHALQEYSALIAYSNMIHSHHDWDARLTKPRTGEIDAGGWIADASLVKRTSWEDKDYGADGAFFEAMKNDWLIKGHPERIVKVEGFYFVHN